MILCEKTKNYYSENRIITAYGKGTANDRMHESGLWIVIPFNGTILYGKLGTLSLTETKEDIAK